jgi:uncharacterized protein
MTDDPNKPASSSETVTHDAESAADMELVRISALALDPRSQTPVVVLRETEGPRHVPIWIGLLEAHSIAAQMEGIVPNRPLTHDLLINTLEQCGGHVIRAEITDLEDNTFYARVRIALPDREFWLDARPSDAISLALRADAPIFVSSEILDVAAKGPQVEIVSGEDDEDGYEKLLATLPEDHMGGYRQ